MDPHSFIPDPAVLLNSDPAACSMQIKIKFYNLQKPVINYLMNIFLELKKTNKIAEK